MRSRPLLPGALRPLLAAALLSLAPLALAGHAEAQIHRGALTVLGGYSAHGDLTPGLAGETIFQSGWVAGVQAEGWLGRGRVGLRLNGLFTQRLLETTPGGDYNVYAADLDLLVRLLTPRTDRIAAPYLALGAGATRYASVAGSPTLAGGVYGGDPVDRAHILAGLGVDFLPANPVGLRIEAADKIVLPSVGESPEASGLPIVHNLILTAGLQLRLGGPRAVQIIAAAPDRPPVEVTVEVPEGPLLYTIQPFTFVEAATADRWAARLRDRGIPVWLMDTVIQGEPVSRVRVGALESETEARELAATLERDYGWDVSVERVAADEPVPANAVLETRAFLTRQ